jgi:hypothetical protein
MFTYLKLWADDGKICAEVVNSGHLNFSSLGGPNSKTSHQPFAVFEIEKFSGLQAIDADDLLAELLRRMTPEQLAERAGRNIAVEDHMRALAEYFRRNGKV